MDPVTTSLVVGSAVGGAAGSFIKELTSNGVKWLIELVTAQSPAMQAIAKSNMENFVTRLAQRVERLENDIPAEKAEIFKSALNHPSSALLIKAAIVDSATTDNEEKHELLAELIAQRLTANADDMIALAGAAACGVVNSLTSRQIKILAILATTKAIRPLEKAKISEPSKAKDYILQWWKKNIEPFVVESDFSRATALDFEHLAALGCLRISIGSSDLLVTVSNGFVEPNPTFAKDELKTHKWYSLLESQWEGLGHSTPTSIGQLIGILHRDSKLKSSTKINW